MKATTLATLTVTGFVMLVACAGGEARSFDPNPTADASTADSAPSVDSGTFSHNDADVSAGTDCKRDITLGKLTISPVPECFVNEHVANQTATLDFKCNGGKATAEFGTHMFVGTVDGTSISLKDVEPFVFNACNWQSTETITGDLDTGTIEYSYAEQPVVSCDDLPCTAGGTVVVSAGQVTVVR